MNKPLKIVLKTIASIILTIFLLVCAALIGSYYWLMNENDKILHTSKFDKALWMEAGSEDYNVREQHHSECTRGKMHYDLTDNYLQKGMSKKEVFELLGKPDYGVNYSNHKDREYCLAYNLGGCSVWFGTPGKILAVCLRDNKVVDVFDDSRNNDAITLKIADNGE